MSNEEIEKKLQNIEEKIEKISEKVVGKEVDNTERNIKIGAVTGSIFLGTTGWMW